MVDILFMESVTEESIVSVKNEVDYIISGRTIETITEPVNTHISRAHGIEHVVLKVLKRVSHLCVCHVDIIGTGSDASGVLVCHLGRWLARPQRLYQLEVVNSISTLTMDSSS